LPIQNKKVVRDVTSRQSVNVNNVYVCLPFVTTAVKAGHINLHQVSPSNTQ